MRFSWTSFGVRQRGIAAATACLVCCCASAPLAFAQDAAPPSVATGASPPKPGLFESVGRWFDQGAANFRDHLRGAKRKMDDLGEDTAAKNKEFSDQAAKIGEGAADVGKDAADVTKNAMDAVAKLPTARMMSGRERCASAPNGAPDCVAAAEALCRKHGYSTGRSMDFTSAEECPARTLLGQSDECTSITFISRAMCQ